MIASLRGTVAEKGPSEVVVDVGGVGYRVFVSLLTLTRLPDEGQAVRLRVRTVVREDALDLFGFLSAQEEELFLMLTSVSHVGPRLALSVMSGLEVPELVTAIGRGEVARLTKIHGVGKKTAERLVLELRDKVKSLVLPAHAVQAAATAAPAPTAASADVVSGLVNLGFKPPQAEKAVEAAVERLGMEAGFELLFRESLKALRGAKA
ncbi:MAG: Holliday junction branch migration protein RuvA [Myxococcaceae bacterium]|nr:Holliday junction branch migration protein RuvA [Myxococcaceae bacterium]MCI0671741.1 Holliday junction branch migration protein RuvA [Myxococcaceae bacterium]